MRVHHDFFLRATIKKFSLVSLSYVVTASSVKLTNLDENGGLIKLIHTMPIIRIDNCIVTGLVHRRILRIMIGVRRLNSLSATDVSLAIVK